MDIRNTRQIRQTAKSTLAAAPGLKRLVLLHTLVTAAVLLAVTAANHILENRIGTTGGLSGMGVRGMLTTATTVLQLAVSLAMPFWAIGYTAVVLRTLHGQPCEDRSLLLGFANFGPVLRLSLLKELLVLLLAMVLLYPSMLLFMATPWAQPLLSVMLTTTGDLNSEALYAAVEAVTGPMLVMFMIVVLLAAVPIFFRLRFAELCLMEAPERGAIVAMLSSIRLTKGSCLSLLKVDLGFWWYYVLTALVAAIAYVPTVVTLTGISLPVNGTVLFFGAYIVHLTAQVGLDYWAKNRVSLTYGVCWQTLLQNMAPPQPQQNYPWSE